MSIECFDCERDLRGEHAPDCKAKELRLIRKQEETLARQRAEIRRLRKAVGVALNQARANGLVITAEIMAEALAPKRRARK